MAGSAGSPFVHACSRPRKPAATNIATTQHGRSDSPPTRRCWPRDPCCPSQRRRRQRRRSRRCSHRRGARDSQRGRGQQPVAKSSRQPWPASAGLRGDRSRQLAEARIASGTWRPRRRRCQRCDTAPPCLEKSAAYHLNCSRMSRSVPHCPVVSIFIILGACSSRSDVRLLHLLNQPCYVPLTQHPAHDAFHLKVLKVLDVLECSPMPTRA